jgi:hypothetical protein
VRPPPCRRRRQRRAARAEAAAGAASSGALGRSSQVLIKRRQRVSSCLAPENLRGPATLGLLDEARRDGRSFGGQREKGTGRYSARRDAGWPERKWAAQPRAAQKGPQQGRSTGSALRSRRWRSSSPSGPHLLADVAQVAPGEPGRAVRECFALLAAELARVARQDRGAAGLIGEAEVEGQGEPSPGRGGAGRGGAGRGGWGERRVAAAGPGGGLARCVAGRRRATVPPGELARPDRSSKTKEGRWEGAGKWRKGGG